MMCIAVCYSLEGRIVIVHFTNVKAQLPVKKKQNGIELLAWGRRPHQTGKLPLGGWASLDSIKQGKWDQYFPKAVKLPLHKFMENDFTGKSEWFDVTGGYWVQGLLLQHENEKRVYIVTLVPELPESLYLRWPRILTD